VSAIIEYNPHACVDGIHLSFSRCEFSKTSGNERALLTRANKAPKRLPKALLHLSPPAGSSPIEVITVSGTGKPEAGSVARLPYHVGVTDVAIDVVVVLKAAHWPCQCPSTQRDPCPWVGGGDWSLIK
jgi:hypothetical protein